MSDERAQTQKPEKGSEQQKAADKPIKGAAITNTADNRRQEMVERANAVRSFRTRV
jgi:hypothetical protein